ncbi:PPE domain-containing protein [Actinophytocola sp.]|uniref:PPE domain-containing protein n=1 Tax=Actinophytocola sp. TaxID=1872138 RepID=UPI002D7FA9BF|nr:PPE domain-containing protein [Actinophytocola sp.]HET9142767.1 PPE domain-containing protein [Actinophytocola sp.]
MADTDSTRWQGFTHKELYQLLHEGAGPTASAEPSRRWSEIAATLTEVGEDLAAALDRARAGWTGPAAGQAFNRLSGLAGWAQLTGGNAAEMRTAVEAQAEHLARARAEMPVPEDAPAAAPDPAAAAPVQVIAAQHDLEPVETAATAGQQKAFEVMTAYQLSTDGTTTALATFDPPDRGLTGGEIHRHGRPGVAVTTPAVAVGHLPAPAMSTEPQDHRHGHGHGRGPHWDFGGGGTGGAAANETPAPARPGRGSYTGMALPGSSVFDSDDDEHRPGRRYTGAGRTGTGLGPSAGTGAYTGTGTGTYSGPGSGSTYSGPGGGGISGPAPGVGAGPGSPGGTGGAPGAGSPAAGGPGVRSTAPTSGSSIGAGFTGLHGGIDTPDMQSAAASQMAAAAGTPAAATPGAAAGTGMSGGQDRGMMRRGFDVIGSGQWFGDAPDQEVRGAAPTRRNYDAPDRVTEPVSIDGEEHNLPPTVIGD